MKKYVSDAWRHSNCFAHYQAIFNRSTLFLLSIIAFGILFSGCKKDVAAKEEAAPEVLSSSSINMAADFENLYSGLAPQTVAELQQARAATAKYRNVENALRDGYQDIAVDVEHMGHHYMNFDLVYDNIFDIKKPEILVYNRDENGRQQLVAVEYAVPLTLPMPEGFTGPHDVWNGTSGFPFWLLHAWVWAYNPDGVFNWTNSTVHLH